MFAWELRLVSIGARGGAPEILAASRCIDEAAARPGRERASTDEIAWVRRQRGSPRLHTLGRMLAERMTRSLGQSVLVEKLTGAGGTM
jgi:hypothetical protein